MSDFTYNLVWTVGYPAFWVSARPTLLHRERVPRTGAIILAANHLSEYDVPCLIADTPRRLDFMSVVEFLRNPLTAAFFRGMNCFFLDRGRFDPVAVRAVLDRLERGRAVAMFPEGNIRTEETSLLRGGPFKPGVARLAQMCGAPVVPCVVRGTAAYRKVASWLPLKRTWYGINYGEPMRVRTDLDPHAARAAFVDDLKRAYAVLDEELRAARAEEVRGSKMEG